MARGVGRIGWVGLFWDVRAAEAMTKLCNPRNFLVLGQWFELLTSLNFTMSQLSQLSQMSMRKFVLTCLHSLASYLCHGRFSTESTLMLCNPPTPMISQSRKRKAHAKPILRSLSNILLERTEECVLLCWGLVCTVSEL